MYRKLKKRINIENRGTKVSKTKEFQSLVYYTTSENKKYIRVITKKA